jgi:glycosyltransferase involved in cell wall biosynthesis
MPGFYPQVGAVVVSSTHEGAGLPALEAAAAGRLVISTPVGHWDRIGTKGAVEMPVEAESFVQCCSETLIYYKNNPKEYQVRCLTIQEHAREYDWINHVESWVELIK